MQIEVWAQVDDVNLRVHVGQSQSHAQQVARLLLDTPGVKSVTITVRPLTGKCFPIRCTAAN